MIHHVYTEIIVSKEINNKIDVHDLMNDRLSFSKFKPCEV